MTTTPVTTDLVKWASLEVRAEPGPDVVHSPVTGQPCAYWRLRVVERLTAGSDLVHELASSERFDLVWNPGRVPDLPRWNPSSEARQVPTRSTWGSGDRELRVRLDPASARIEGAPGLHRPGSQGALAVAREFGFVGAISVEETIIRPGDVLDVEGVLESPTAGATFRTAEGRLELFDAVVRQRSRSLAPVLLPWAFGTVAAVLGGMGLATWAAWQAHLIHPRGAAHALGIGPQLGRAVVPARVGTPTPLRPRMP